MYLSIFNSFRVIRCLSQRVSPKIATFTTFVSPGDAPGAITLDVVWMEREFDAYKLSRCMCPSNYNCYWDTARYWSKIINFFISPLAFDAPVRGVPVGIAPPRFVRKNKNCLATTWWKNFEDIFIHFGATHERDRQTDGRTPGDSIYRAYAHASRGNEQIWLVSVLSLWHATKFTIAYSMPSCATVKILTVSQ